MYAFVVCPQRVSSSSGNLAATTTATTSTANGHKGTVSSSSHLPGSGGAFHNGGSTVATDSSPAFATIASPARRCEVSPIQCHVSVITRSLSLSLFRLCRLVIYHIVAWLRRMPAARVNHIRLSNKSCGIYIVFFNYS